MSTSSLTFQKPGAKLLALGAVALSAMVGMAMSSSSERDAIAIAGASALLAAATVAMLLVNIGAIGRIALAGFLMLVPLNALRISTNVAFSDALLVVAFLSTLSVLITTPYRVYRGVETYLWSTLLITVGSLIGVFFSDNPADSLIGVVKFAIASMVFVCAAQAMDLRISTLTLLTKLWCLSIVANCVLATAGFNTNAFTNRPRALSLHPNHLALTAVMALAFGISFALGAQSAWSRLFWIAAAAVAANGILVSGSRSGIIGGLVAVLTIAIMRRQWKALAVIATVVTSATVLVRNGTIQFTGSSALERLLTNSDLTQASNVAREEKLAVALDTVRDHLFTGSGFSGTILFHSLPLQILGATGLIGFAGFLLLLYTATEPLRRTSTHRNPDAGEQTLIIGALSAFLGFLTADLFQNAIWERFAWIPVSVLMLALAKRRTRPTSEGTHQNESVKPGARPTSDLSVAN